MKPGATFKKFTPLGGKKPTKFKPPLIGSSFSSSKPSSASPSSFSLTSPSMESENDNTTSKKPAVVTVIKKPRPLQTHVTPRNTIGSSEDQISSSSCSRDDDMPKMDPASQERKKANVRAMMSGNIQIERKPFMSNGILGSVGFKRFKPPGDPGSYTKSLAKKLGGGVYSGKGLLRPKFSSSGGGGSFQRTAAPKLRLSVSVDMALSSDGDSTSEDDSSDDEGGPKAEFLPHEPLTVWEPSAEEATDGYVPLQVPPVLAQFLRPHQRAGVEFCCECLLGMREFEGNGCILADDMGLGKTLQSIATLYTMLRNGKRGPDVPLVRRAIVVCPCSLVNNWAQEFEKWINSRVKTEAEKVRALPMSATDKKSVTFAIAQFLHVSRPYDVLVISYETFRMYVNKFTKKNETCCDLLICDEAHRLKNPDALTTKALAALACRKRVLLSGTPVQNDLDEFFAMADFTNPGVLGTSDEFRKRYKNPILVGREPGASQPDQDRAKVLQNEMSGIVNQFILRRTNTINAKFLPDKLVQVVCCKLTETQVNLYRHLVGSKDVQAALSGKVKDALSYIQNLQKLCNHPKILELSCGGKTKGVSKEELSLFGVPLDSADQDAAAKNNIHPALSGKMLVLHNLMDVMWKDQTPKKPPDKIVVISIYTQTLDLVERMCKGRKWPVVRLDGSLAVKKRMELVNAFNDPTNRNAFCFLLSSKAGGCGINLIGANRLVLFDSDWNPATDKQAAARCWRDGQKKHCYTYRFLSAGTLEEKIFQRQLSKEGLAAVIEDKEQVNALSANDLKSLFKFRENTPSDTHDKLKCTHCRLALEADGEGEDMTLGHAQVQFLDDIIEWLRALPEAQHFLSASSGTVMEVSTGANAVPGEAAVALIDDFSARAASSSSSSSAGVSKPSGKAGKVKMGDLTALHQKLHSGGFTKLADFHKDVRQMCSVARKVFDPGSAPYNDAEALRELFDERWTAASAHISSLSTAANARVFTEEELAGAAASIESHELASSSGPARPVRKQFNMPGKPKPIAVLKPGGTGKSMSCSSSSSSSSSNISAEGGGESSGKLSKRSSLSQAPFKPQHEMPKEEDLNNWSHHFSVDTIEDAYLRQATAGTDLVSFVFGLKVTWELTQAQTALDEERELQDKERRDADLETAKGRLGSKKSKKKKKGEAALGESGRSDGAAAEEEEVDMETLQAQYDAGGQAPDVLECQGMEETGVMADDEGGGGDAHDEAGAVVGRQHSDPPALNRVSAASEADPVPDESVNNEVICSTCTFSNARKNKKCQICGVQLPPASAGRRNKRSHGSIQPIPEVSTKKEKKSKAKAKTKEVVPVDEVVGTGTSDSHLEDSPFQKSQKAKPKTKKKKKKSTEKVAGDPEAVSDLSAEAPASDQGVVEILDDSPMRTAAGSQSDDEDDW